MPPGPGSNRAASSASSRICHGRPSRRTSARRCAGHGEFLRKAFRQIRNVIQHVVGDHRVEFSIGYGMDCASAVSKRNPWSIAPRFVRACCEHSGGDIGKRDLPAGRNAIRVFPPQITRTASHFQNPALRGQGETVEHPPQPAAGICAETTVERDARVQIRGVAVLVRQGIVDQIISLRVSKRSSTRRPGSSIPVPGQPASAPHRDGRRPDGR